MCTSPIKIINNSHYCDKYRHKMYHVVPCGKCSECIRQRRDAFVSRCYAQHLDSTQTYFYTLTYNNESLPNCMGIPCFDKKEVQKFLKRLRNYLDAENISFKYLITCEYGELRHRPHYHALFFLNGSVSPFRFLSIMRRAWIYGFVCPGDSLGLVTNRLGGISYVCKYITKQDNVFDKSLKIVFDRYYTESRVFTLQNTKSYAEWDELSNYNEITKYSYQVARKASSFARCRAMIRSSVLHEVSSDYAKHMVKEYKKEHGMFVLISKHLGESYLTKIDKLNPCIKLPTKNGYVEKPIPLYYYRKLYFDVTKDYWNNNRYVLNADGINYLMTKFEQSIDDKANEFQSLLSADILACDSLWQYLFAKLPNNSLSIKTQFLNYCKLFNVFGNKFDYWRNIAYYDIVYRGRYCYSFKDFEYDLNVVPLECPEIDYLYSIKPKLTDYDYFTPKDFQYYVEHDCLFHAKYDTHPCFSPIIEFHELLLVIKQWLKNNKELEKLREENAIIKLKELFPIKQTVYTSIPDYALN